MQVMCLIWQRRSGSSKACTGYCQLERAAGIDLDLFRDLLPRLHIIPEAPLVVQMIVA
jgi:hypothetical protein